MGSFAPLNNAGQQGGSAMTGSYSPTPSTMTPPPPQPGGGMRLGYDIINSPAIPGQQPQGFAALGPAIGSALGGMGAGISTTPPPMQNPFMGGQPQLLSGIDPRAVAANPQGYQTFMQQMQERETQMPGSTMLANQPGGQFGQALGQLGMGGQPQGMTPPPPVQQPQRTFAGAIPSIKEFRDATGADFKTASDLLYGVVGSSKDTRDWQKIFSSPDPIAAARQATAAMYGGVQQGTYTDPVTGKQNTMLMSGTGIPLTTPGSRDVNFGVGLTPNSGANFVSGLATNDRFPGAGAQQIQGQIPLQNPPTMGVGGGASQPMTVQDMIAKASGLIGSQGVGMGQPYISDRGYFGPGTMDNPTGPQYGGQDRVVTQVARPLTDVPQYGGGMGQPVNFYDADRATGDYRNRMAMDKGVGSPSNPQQSMINSSPQLQAYLRNQQQINQLRPQQMGQPITSVGRQPPQPRMMPEALQNLRRRIGSGSGGISNLLNRIRG